MKRLLALMLALMTGLCAPFAMAENAQTQEILSSLEDMLAEALSSVNTYAGNFAFGGTLYVYTQAGAVYQEVQGEHVEKIRAPFEGASTLVIPMGEQVYIIARDSGALLVVSLATMQQARYDLSWDKMALGQEGDARRARMRSISDGAVADDMLYLLVQNDARGTDVWAFDYQAATLEVMEMTFSPDEIMAYGQELLLMSKERLDAYDLKNGETRTLLMGAGLGGLCTSGDVIFLRAGDEILSNQSGEFETVGYLAAGSAANQLSGGAVLGTSYHYLASGVPVSCSVDAGSLPAFSLKVCGLGNDARAGLSAFANLYPDVPVVRLEDDAPLSAQEVTAAMRGTNAADVYLVRLDKVNLEALKAKDYLMPLDASLLPEGLSQKYVDAVTFDGQVYALPQSVRVSMPGVNLSAFEALGLTALDVPGTYEAFLDFVDLWQEDLSIDYPDYQLFSNMARLDLETLLLEQILRDTELKASVLGEDADYFSSDLRALIARLSETDFSGFRSFDEEQVNAFAARGGTSDENTLFTMSLNVLPSNRTTRYVPMPLALSDTDAAYVPASLSVYIVSPDTLYEQEVMALLDCLISNTAAASRIALIEADTQPVFNQVAVMQTAAYQAALDYLNERMSAADEETSAALKVTKSDLERTLQRLERSLYTVTPDAIAVYKAQDAFIKPRKYGVMNGETTEILTLESKLLTGALKADNFLKEIDKTVEMMRLEGN